ncbi:MAG: hypothetical protein K0V04_45760, partial [Deltaproteobacteria bacterium]|nr:hypothetical protein [Deltaproteobacteria bacterium]
MLRIDPRSSVVSLFLALGCGEPGGAEGSGNTDNAGTGANADTHSDPDTGSEPGTGADTDDDTGSPGTEGDPDSGSTGDSGEPPLEPSTQFEDAVDWSVPSGGWAGQGFVRMAASASDAGDDDWVTTDINGDGYPDLVVTAHYDGTDFEVLGFGGDAHWDVFEGSAAGFADTATSWSVPNGGWAGQGFLRLGASASDAGDDDWTTLDINGDGYLDLVVTAHYDGTTFEVLDF